MEKSGRNKSSRVMFKEEVENGKDSTKKKRKDEEDRRDIDRRG